ncbi:hypothetical protein KHU50_011748 [Colletotrichum sp. SAR 10_65]|nr:hypothetical protein KHU50_011748 [Colletotrichum sp. SAR 10_65]KAJ5004941.1 hypothetical protein K4K48_008576 [Colletotrichum sp. SAR 10_66]
MAMPSRKSRKRLASRAEEHQGGKKKARIEEVAYSDDSDYRQSSDDSDVDTDSDLQSLIDLGISNGKSANTSATAKRKTPATKGRTAQEDPEDTDEDDDMELGREETSKGKSAKTSAMAKKTSSTKRKGKTAQDEERVCEGKSPAWVNFETMFFGIVDGQEILRAFNKRFPRLKAEELDDLLPDTIPDEAYDEDWTAEDEVSLKSKWQKNPQRTKLIDYKDSTLPKLFRATLRIFHMAPFEIVSAKYFLGYEGKSANKSQKWTTTFSQYMYELVVHPLWNFDINMFRTAMQYAVILRTRDTRTWKLVAPNNDVFFQVFKQVIADFKGQDRPMTEHHSEVRERLQSRAITIPPYSEFLRRLEDTVVVHEDVDSDASNEQGPVLAYKVNNHDLKHIKEALDSLANIGMPYFLSTEVYSRYILGSRQDVGKGAHKGEENKDEPPVGGSNLKEYIGRALLALRRGETKEAKRRKRLRQESQDEIVQDEIMQAESSALAETQAQLNAEKESTNKLRIRLKARDTKIARLEKELEDLRNKAPQGTPQSRVDSSDISSSDTDSDEESVSGRKMEQPLIPEVKREPSIKSESEDTDTVFGSLASS